MYCFLNRDQSLGPIDSSNSFIDFMLLRQSQASARSTMCGSLCSGAALGGITKNLVQRYYVEGDPEGLSHLVHLQRRRHSFLQNKLSQPSELLPCTLQLYTRESPEILL